MRAIRDRLIGAWTLVSFESRLPDGRLSSPLGRGARGHIVYAECGLVSVNLSRGDRPVADGDRIFQLRGEAAIAAAGRGYMAYSGRFEVDEAQGLARHHLELCLDPSWIGTVQERHVRFVDDRLQLSVGDPRGTDGVGNPSTLTWQRI